MAVGYAATCQQKQSACHQRRMNNDPPHSLTLSRVGQDCAQSQSIRTPLAINNC
jgi:hypothetical protein